MVGNVTYALSMIVGILFNLYMMALMARLVLQISRANPFNPITRFIITVTKYPVMLFQRFIPTVKHVDFAIILALFIITLIKIYLTTFLSTEIILPNVLGVAVWSIGDIFIQLGNLFFYALIIQVIASWIASGYNPGLEVVYHITSPILKPFRRLIPAIGGIDVSPIVAILLLKAFEIIISWPLVGLGRALSVS